MRHLLVLWMVGVVGVAGGAVMADVPEPVFERQVIDDDVEIGYGVAVGDVNGNGRVDILLADARQIVWYENPGEPGEAWQRHVMAENLTQRHNVCIAARDITGDGQVEVAVGAQWNPGETEDAEASGAVFYLHRPADPTERWEPTQITPHDPTTHRMRWVQVGEGEFQLAVLPLHGIGNQGGEGDPVRLQLVTPPDDLAEGEWESEFVDTQMNMTHNFDVVTLPDEPSSESSLIVGRQGVAFWEAGWRWVEPPHEPDAQHAAGEICATFNEATGWVLVATIEPMHGNSVAAFSGSFGGEPTRHVLDDTLEEGHALAVHDFLGTGLPQVAAGWRNPNAEGKVGVRLYAPLDDSGTNWQTFTIDDDQMAAEDMAVADFDDDGATDIVVAGRATNNLVIYWNRTERE